MSARTMTAAASCACVFFLAASAHGQSLPAMGTAKAAASGAAAATNEHVRAEQNPQQQAAPAKPAPKPAAATPAPAKTAAAPAGAPAKTAAAPAPTKGTPAPAANTKPQMAATAPAKGGAKGAPATAAAPGKTTTEQGSSVSQRGGKSEISLLRETFTYQADNRRDPFLSLMRSGDLRPMVSDLRLVAVIYDPAGHSVAILRDLQTKEQYRVKVGQTLGRMRVNQIRPNQVIFTIEEIGMTRQEALAMNDITKARTQ